MLYQIYCQGKLYKTVDVVDAVTALTQATLDRDAGKIPGYDATKLADFKIVPA